MEEKIDNLNEKIVEFSNEHPSAYLAACCGLGLIVSIPLMIVQFKLYGKCTAKEVVKELAKLNG